MSKTNVRVKLIGEDGNAFAIIGKVSKALRREGYNDISKEYVSAATNSKSYDDLLCVTMSYVEIE